MGCWVACRVYEDIRATFGASFASYGSVLFDYGVLGVFIVEVLGLKSDTNILRYY